MKGVFSLEGVVPQLAPSAWVAPTAAVIGDVELKDGASVWFGATLRGDTATITIGRNSNIQDGSVGLDSARGRRRERERARAIERDPHPHPPT